MKIPLACFKLTIYQIRILFRMKLKVIGVTSALFILAASAVFYTANKKPKPIENSATSSTEVTSNTGEQNSNAPALVQIEPQKRVPNSIVLPDAVINTADVLTIKLPGNPQWFHNATVYQIWVRSFYDSDNDGNGDLLGVKEKIPYLKELGITAVWLSPIFESPSYHGYDVQDFYSIEKDFGTIEDFNSLITTAKDNDIKIILDLPLNHVSEEHEWFKKSLSNDAQYNDYFVWQEKIPEGYGKAWEDKIEPTAVWHSKEEREGFYYGVFGWTQPDLNYRNPKVVEEAKNIASYWLEKGVDGFRLDAIRYILEDKSNGQADTEDTIAFWREFTNHVKNINPDTFLVGEALTEIDKISPYFDDGYGIDQAFEFNFNFLIESMLKDVSENETSTSTDENKELQASSMRDALWQRLSKLNHQEAPDYFFGSVINNHDNERLNVFFGENDVRAKIAASLLLLNPGTIFVYYGEEIGMTQYSTDDDLYRRSLMQWDGSENAGFNNSNKRWIDNKNYFYWLDNYSPWWTAYWERIGNRSVRHVEHQTNKQDSLLEHYRQLIKLRSEVPLINSPTYIQKYNNTGFTWVTKYSDSYQDVITILNLDPENNSHAKIPDDIQGMYKDLIGNHEAFLSEEISLSPGELRVLLKVPDV